MSRASPESAPGRRSRLLLDAAKGYLAVWLAARFTGGNIRWMMLAALLAMIGHSLPRLAGLPRGTRRGHRRGRLSADLLAGSGGRSRDLDSGGGVLAIRFAGLDLGGGGAAAAGLSTLCAGARPARRCLGGHARWRWFW